MVGLAGLAMSCLAVFLTANAVGGEAVSSLAKVRELQAVQRYLGIAISCMMLPASTLNSQKRTAAALRASEGRLALQATSEGLWNLDVRSGETYFSPRYYTLLGYRPGEFPNSYQAWKELLHPDDVPRVERSLAEAQAGPLHGQGQALLAVLQSGFRFLAAVHPGLQEQDVEDAAPEHGGDHLQVVFVAVQGGGQARPFESVGQGVKHRPAQQRGGQRALPAQRPAADEQRGPREAQHEPRTVLSVEEHHGGDSRREVARHIQATRQRMQSVLLACSRRLKGA